jgi:CPA2 family monovalent cation:H+ antiporter-2
VAAALVAVTLILASSARFGDRLSRAVFSGSDEVSLLTLLGITLLVAGVTEQLNVSAAVGAFLVGIGVSGEAAHRARKLLTPLRDVFAGVFFVFFGLSIDPAQLPGVALPVVLLAVVTGTTKMLTGWWAARRMGVGPRGRRRAATALIARGEFSIVIAGLGTTAGAGPRLSAIAAGYVLVMATLGPIAARFASRQPSTTPPRKPPSLPAKPREPGTSGPEDHPPSGMGPSRYEVMIEPTTCRGPVQGKQTSTWPRSEPPTALQPEQ